MRALLRILFVLMFLLGALLAVVYPMAVGSLASTEIGRFPLLEPAGGFRSVETDIADRDQPVFVSIDLMTRRAFEAAKDRAVLTVTAARGGQTVFAEALDFDGVKPRETSPQSVEFTYRADIGRIEPGQPGRYSFVVAPGDADSVDVVSADLVLDAGAFSLDARAQPSGFILMALGFIGFVLAFRRFTGTTPKKAAESPPERKWGRDGGN